MGSSNADRSHAAAQQHLTRHSTACADINSQVAIWSIKLKLNSAPQEFAKTQDRLAAFLTYADNAAVGYFKKQGFTAAITLPRERVRPPCISRTAGRRLPAFACMLKSHCWWGFAICDHRDAEEYTGKCHRACFSNQCLTPLSAVAGLDQGLRRRHADGVPAVGPHPLHRGAQHAQVRSCPGFISMIQKNHFF